LKILIAQSNSKLKDRYNLYLDNLPTGVEVLEVSSLVQLQSALESIDEIDLIIAEQSTNGIEGMTISSTVLNELNSDLIINSNEELSKHIDNEYFSSLAERAHLIKNDTNCESFQNLVLDILKRRKKLNFQYQEEKYRKVRLVYFLRFNKVLCDVFIKLNDDKYVKVLKKDDIYTRDDLQKYRSKAVKFLYIESSEYDNFSSDLASTPYLIEDKKLSSELVEDAVINTLDIVHEMVGEVGVTEEVLNLVDYSVYQIESTLDDDKILSKLMNNLKERKDYLLDHSYMMAYFSNSICSHMNWDSEEIKKKLAYASLLQDLTVTDAQLAYDYNLQTNNLSKYSADEIEIYKKHPENISSLISSKDRIPLNVDEIVLCQHERPKGLGFPRQFTHQRVSQLSAVFIISHVFVDELFRVNFDLEKIPKILNSMKEDYDEGNYKKPFKGLLDVFKKYSAS
jgi:HD-GYP domain-containing protein (c-di-GMP phosphodiesterase class II)